MKRKLTLILATALLMLSFSLGNAQKKGHVTVPTLTPAPAPAPQLINITQLLSDAGPLFQTFLNYLESTKVIDIFQNQTNNSKEGLTLFVPTNIAFSSLKEPSLSNLTQDQLKQVCLFHALPHYYSFSDFKNLSIGGPVTVPTFSGGSYTLNFTDDKSGAIGITSGWSVTKTSISVAATPPVAIYKVDKVLLPEAIFGTNIPPMPAPALAPKAISPPADNINPADKGPSSSKDYSDYFVLALLGIPVLSFSSAVLILVIRESGK